MNEELFNEINEAPTDLYDIPELKEDDEDFSMDNYLNGDIDY
jgi:hypothetical protein